MKTLRPNDKRGRIARISLLILVVAKLACIFVDYIQYDLLMNVANGNYVSMEEAERSDNIHQAVYILSIIVFVVAFIFLIQWFRRAYYNLHTQVNVLKYGDGWAAGGWFIPFGCLFIPYQIMSELYTETTKLIKGRKDENFKLSKRWLPWWWTVWILSTFISGIAGKLLGKDETLTQLITGTVFSMIDEIVSIISIVLTLIVMTDYQEVEPFLHEVEVSEPELQLLSEEAE